MESLASQKDDWLFDADNYLKYSSTEKWDIIPPDKRTDRQTLIKVASDYDPYACRVGSVRRANKGADIAPVFIDKPREGDRAADGLARIRWQQRLRVAAEERNERREPRCQQRDGAAPQGLRWSQDTARATPKALCDIAQGCRVFSAATLGVRTCRPG